MPALVFKRFHVFVHILFVCVTATRSVTHFSTSSVFCALHVLSTPHFFSVFESFCNLFFTRAHSYAFVYVILRLFSATAHSHVFLPVPHILCTLAHFPYSSTFFKSHVYVHVFLHLHLFQFLCCCNSFSRAFRHNCSSIFSVFESLCNFSANVQVVQRLCHCNLFILLIYTFYAFSAFWENFSTQLNVLIRLCTFRLFCAFTRFSNSSNMHWHMFTLLQGILYACARFLRLCHSNSFLLRIGTSFRLLHAFSVYWPVFFTHLYIFMHLSLCNSVILRIYTFFYLLRWFSAHCHVYLSTPRLFSLLESFSFILRMCTFLCVCACSSACV